MRAEAVLDSSESLYSAYGPSALHVVSLPFVSVLVERRQSPRGEVSGPIKTRSLNIMSVAYSRSRRRERWRDTHKASVTQIPSTRDTCNVTDRSSTISDPLDSALGRPPSIQGRVKDRPRGRGLTHMADCCIACIPRTQPAQGTHARIERGD